MQEKLREMLLVQRPTVNGRLPTNELDKILKVLGFDYLVAPDVMLKLKSEVLDKENRGEFE